MLKVDSETNYDLIVCGGGAAGVAAAIGAAKEGAKVCLIEKYGFLGGAATNAQVLAYCGFFQQGSSPVSAVSGVGDEIVSELKKHGLDGKAHCSETTGNWIILLDPEVLKHSLDNVIKRYGIDLRLHTRVAAVMRTGQSIEGVTIAGMSGRQRLFARTYIDASGDANLAMLTGLEYRIGDYEQRIQAATMPVRIGGISPNTEIDRQLLQKLIAEYNVNGRLPFPRTDGGIYTRLPISADMWWMTIDLELKDLDSVSFTKAEIQGRDMAFEYLQLLRDKMPGFEKAYIASTGPQVGVRETRHPQARYELTQEDALNGRQRADGIGRAAWPIEVHKEAGKPYYKSIGGDGYFHVPYDSIRAKGVDNLWYAGRVIGADPEAYGSIRVMGTAFATGQAAGVAAASFADHHDSVNVPDVRKRLLSQGAII